MFADALDKLAPSTAPIILLSRNRNGKIDSAVGSFVVLNKDGWCASAWHIFEIQQRFRQSKQNSTKRDAEEARIRREVTNKKERSKALRGLPAHGPADITNWSEFLGWTGAKPTDIIALPIADLVVFRLDPFDPNWVSDYPILRDPADRLRQGTSLCRLGFPFYQAKAEFNFKTGKFNLPEGTFPVPRFPIEGIYTRELVVELPPELKAKLPFGVKFIETSSPGLMGQSGGPVFDTDGRVWGIQSRTTHHHLGFSPPIPGGKKGEEEHQFLNTGVAVHPETLVGVLRDRGIQFEVG